MTELERIAHEHEPIRLLDPLAEFLGLRAVGEPIAYSLEDAGRYAGHLCPTVATAFEMTRLALRTLYPDTTPVRGSLRVTVASAPDQFANGPLARVIGYVTGAAGEDGFRGLSGRWSRQNLLRYAPKDEPFGSVLFERLDNGRSVRLLATPEVLAADGPNIGPLLAEALRATQAHPEFQQAWAHKVSAVLKAGPDMFRVVDQG
jgi:hypothetical protein